MKKMTFWEYTKHMWEDEGGWVQVAVFVVAALAAAYGAYQQAQYQKQASQYNAQVAENEKEIMKARGEAELVKHREKVRRLKGSQKVALLNSGVSLSGSALDILAETDQQARYDEDIIKYNTAAGVWGKDAEIGLTLARGRQAVTAGNIRAVSTLLSAAGKFSYGSSSASNSQLVDWT